MKFWEKAGLIMSTWDCSIIGQKSEMEKGKLLHSHSTLTLTQMNGYTFKQNSTKLYLKQLLEYRLCFRSNYYLYHSLNPSQSSSLNHCT